MTAFSDLGLDPTLVRNLSAAGYRHPWPVQAAAIPPALEGRDVIGLAETGRGKTAAYLAPVLHALHAERRARAPRGRQRRVPQLPAAERLRAVVVCPTRELATQVAALAETLVPGLQLRVALAYGKVAVRPQLEAIRAGADLVVGTPGRLAELMQEHGVSLARVHHVVLDEADRMLDMGFRPQVDRLLRAMPTEGRRTMLFTATWGSKVDRLASRYLTDPLRAEAEGHTRAASHLEEHLVFVPNREKVHLLLRLFELGHGRGTLVFCGTRRRVGWVGAALVRNGIKADVLHGDRSQAKRTRALEAFASGEVDVLVCTDVAARGLHVERVRTVINYDVPNDAEEYVHRVGRAGHGTRRTGEAWTLLCRRDEEKWERIVADFGAVIPLEEVPGFRPGETSRGPSRGADGAPRGGGGGRRSGRDERTWHVKKASRPGAHRAKGAARPIAKDQKPGGGVRKPKPDD